jgi:NAD(P)H-flavin reductase
MNFSHALTLTGAVTNNDFLRPGIVRAVEGLLVGTDPKKTCILDHVPSAVAQEVATRTGAKYQWIEIKDDELTQFCGDRRKWIQGYFTHVVPIEDLDHIVVLGVPGMVEPVIRAFLSERSSILPQVDKIDFHPGIFVKLVFPSRSRRQAPKLETGTYFNYPPGAVAAVA